jgi:CBS domain-containing protein
LLAGLAILTRHSTAWLRAPVKTVAVAAVALVALQAMPALHLDGGRVLHAWFWYLTDSASAATRAAAMYAHLVAAVLLGVGIVLVARTGEWPYWGLGAVVAGLQLEGGARQAVRRASWLPFDAATTIRVLALPAATRVPDDVSIDDAVERLLATSPDACLLVVGGDGAVRGTLRMIDLRGTRRSMWERTTVGEVARPLEELPRLAIDLPVQEALLRLEDRSGVAVVEDEGRIVAIVSRGSLLAAATDHLRRHE